MTKNDSQSTLIGWQVAVPIALAVIIAAIVFWLGSTWTGDDAAPATAIAVYELFLTLGPVFLWLSAAAGLGVALRFLLRDHLELNGSLMWAAGIALLLVLDTALGSIGAMQTGSRPLGAYAIIGLSFIPHLIAVVRTARKKFQVRIPPSWLWPAMAPAVAVLALAACSAPGWLWESEFGGYDALSYHLQLPMEWMAAGSITPFEHNVYSFLPSYMESAYYHIMLLRGDAHDAVVACQLLHASIAVITAVATGRLVGELLQSWQFQGIPTITSAVVIGTPWVVVAGSLAYNELPVALMLAAGLTIIVRQSGNPIARGAVIGLLMAAAIGSKLTAVGFVLVPVVVVMLWLDSKRWKSMVGAALVGAICLVPWLIRNALIGGNPVFPFMTDLFGTAHWTAEQVRIWNDGHAADLSFAGQFIEAFNQLFRFGFGANPDPTGREPWQPQWSIAPWLGICGAILATTAPRLRRPAMVMLTIMALQLAFWILLTHIKSRFMLPMVVPAACGVALGVLRVQQFLQFENGKTSRSRSALIFGFVTLWCLQPLLLYRAQRDSAPSARIGWTGLLSGADIAEEHLAQAAGNTVVFLNRMLPDDARVLLVGDAAPLYYTADVTYTTVWDRGPMSKAIASHPDDPAVWIKDLKTQGFSHVLLSPTMLEVWERSGWRDPLLDPDTIAAALDKHAAVIARFNDGSVLYGLHAMPR